MPQNARKKVAGCLASERYQNNSMKCIILKIELSEFTTQDGTLLKGANLTLFRENFTVNQYWVPQDKLKQLGFTEKMVSNPFLDDEINIVEVGFDEKPGFKGKPSKIVPTSFRML